MRADIRFKVPQHWKEEIVVDRIATLIYGEERVWFKKTSGYKYCLGTSNDWWIDKERDEYLIAYRYSGEHNKEKLEALRKVIIWLLNIERYN